MNGFVIFLIGAGVSVVGAYFIAATAFKRLWKSNVTHLKLIGFLGLFIVSFFSIAFVIGWLTKDNVAFSR